MATRRQTRVAIRPRLSKTLKARRPKGYEEHPTTLAGRLLMRRKELGLLQREVAKRFGFSHETYINWEKHGLKPDIRQWPKIINFLGYDPHTNPVSLPEKIATYRRRNGLTLLEFGKLVGVHECTVQSWERGKHPPRKMDELEALLQQRRDAFP